MNNNDIKIEVCVDSLESCLNAVKGGASRLELCSSLFLGGLTPTYGMMKIVKDQLPPMFPVNIMIRPREGDFYYSQAEIDIMKEDIKIVKHLGFHGVVIGALTIDGRIDKQVTRELIDCALPLSITFHRAFDMCRDHKEALNDLLEIGNIDRLLTSGLESSVMEGLDTIIDLMDIINNRTTTESKLIIMPGGGVTERNITKIVNNLKPKGLKEIHLSGRAKYDSKMQFRNTRVFMGGELRQSEYTLAIVDDKKIESFLLNANKY